MAAKQFTLTNTGTSNLVIQSVTFNGPSGVGHTANLSNLGGSSTETGNAVLSYNIVPSAVQTFTVDYYDAGVGIGTYTGNIVIGCSNSVIQTIASTVVISSINTTTTTTLAPGLTTTTTTLAPGLTTTTTTSAPTTTTTTTLAPGLTTTTTTRAPTTTTTTTLAPGLTTTTTTSAPTTTTTTTLAPGLTTTTTTSAPTTTSTTSTTTSAPTTTTTTLAPTTTTTTTSGGGPVSPLGFNGKNYTYSGQSAQLTLAIYSDGTWQLIPTNSGPTPTTYNDLTSWTTITGNWYSPTTPGIGSSYIYWIQINSQNQANDGIVGTSLPTNTWVPFPATSEDVAYVSISAAGSDDAEGNFTFKVGQNIITPITLSTSTFTLHGYSATPGTTTTTTAAPTTTTTTTAGPGTTTTTTLAPTTTTTTTSGGGPVSPLGFNGKNYTYSGQSAQLTLAIYADGTWQLIPTNSGPTPTTYNDLTSWNTITGNWYSPTTPDIGSGYIYWIQINSQNQANDGLVGTSIPTNTWVPFPATSEDVAYVSISAAGFDDAEGSFTFKVGQNILAPVILSTSTFTLHGYST